MKKQFDPIDFFDSSQIYLDIISSCIGAIQHYSNITDNEDLKSVSASLNYAISQLKKEYSSYFNSDIPSQSDKENINNEK